MLECCVERLELGQAGALLELGRAELDAGDGQALELAAELVLEPNHRGLLELVLGDVAPGPRTAPDLPCPLEVSLGRELAHRRRVGGVPHCNQPTGGVELELEDVPRGASLLSPTLAPGLEEQPPSLRSDRVVDFTIAVRGEHRITHRDELGTGPVPVGDELHRRVRVSVAGVVFPAAQAHQ